MRHAVLALLAAAACDAPEPADAFGPMPPPVAPSVMAAQGSLQHILSQSAYCVTTAQGGPGEVAIVAIGLDDGRFAPMAIKSGGTPSVSGLVLHDDELIWPGTSGNWESMTVRSWSHQTWTSHGGASWIAADGRRLFVTTPTDVLAASVYATRRQLQAGTPAGSANVLGARIGSAPGALLNAWHSTDAIEVRDPVTSVVLDTVVLEDFDTWVTALAGTATRLVVLDDGRGAYSGTHGRRLAVFDRTTGAGLLNVMLGGWPGSRTVPTSFGPIEGAAGLWCRDT